MSRSLLYAIRFVQLISYVSVNSTTG
jgi:hypothetical protein